MKVAFMCDMHLPMRKDSVQYKYFTDAVNEIKKSDVVCIAGWIPTHAVVKVTEQYRHKPMVLWGLCGWIEDDGRLVTTSDQAGTSGLRKTFSDLGYTFKYVYDIIGLESKSKVVADYCVAASAAAKLRNAKVGMAGYREWLSSLQVSAEHTLNFMNSLLTEFWQVCLTMCLQK